MNWDSEDSEFTLDLTFEKGDFSQLWYLAWYLKNFESTLRFPKTTWTSTVFDLNMPSMVDATIMNYICLSGQWFFTLARKNVQIRRELKTAPYKWCKFSRYAGSITSLQLSLVDGSCYVVLRGSVILRDLPSLGMAEDGGECNSIQAFSTPALYIIHQPIRHSIRISPIGSWRGPTTINLFKLGQIQLPTNWKEYLPPF